MKEKLLLWWLLTDKVHKGVESICDYHMGIAFIYQTFRYVSTLNRFGKS